MKQTTGEHPPHAREAAADANAQHRVRADLKAYLDGELSGLTRWLTARHVARCASCRDEMRRLEHLGRQVRQLDHALPAAHLRARILASLPAAPPANAPAAQRFRPADARARAAFSRRPLSAAMGLCALLLMVGAFALARYGRAGAAGGDAGLTTGLGITSGPLAVNSTPDDAPTAASTAGERGSAPSPVQPAATARTQPDPFAPGTVAQAEGKEKSDADAGAAQHSTPTGAGAGSETASQPAANTQIAYTDPTSAAADRIAATIIPDKLREKRQAAGANPAGASIHSSVSASVPVVKMAASVPMQMAVAVADVSEASRQVRKWAEQAGAQVTVMPSRKAAGMQSPDGASDAVRSASEARAETGGASAGSAAVPPAPPSATVLRLQVPAQYAAGFEAYLSRMAKSAGTAARPKGEDISAAHDLKADAAAARPYPLPARVPEGEPAAQGRHSATVTILVRLQPGSSAPRP